MTETLQISESLLVLDRDNPRLAFAYQGQTLGPKALLRILYDRFELDEIAESFIENGFFPHEPLVAVRDESNSNHFVVVEGNRRLAALRLLIHGPDVFGLKSTSFARFHTAYRALPKKRQTDLSEPWASVVKDRRAVAAYIGFRHVTGIKPWPALEKAGYIAKLIDEMKMSARDVAKMIGSKPAYVARHYQAYRMLSQAKDSEDIETGPVEEDFGVLMRALQADGVREFIDLATPDPDNLDQRPLKKKSHANLRDFMRWTFGTATQAPIVSDSRLLTKFGRILKSARAVEYLRDYPAASFEQAYRMSGGDTEEGRKAIQIAEFALRDALPHARSLRKDAAFRQAVGRAADYFSQILVHFPAARDEYFTE